MYIGYNPLTFTLLNIFNNWCYSTEFSHTLKTSFRINQKRYMWHSERFWSLNAKWKGKLQPVWEGERSCYRKSGLNFRILDWSRLNEVCIPSLSHSWPPFGSPAIYVSPRRKTVLTSSFFFEMPFEFLLSQKYYNFSSLLSEMRSVMVKRTLYQ